MEWQGRVWNVAPLLKIIAKSGAELNTLLYCARFHNYGMTFVMIFYDFAVLLIDGVNKPGAGAATDIP